MAHRKRRWGRPLVASLAALLVLALIPAVVSAASDFDDVPPTNIFYSDISWLADAGVTKGCGATRFCPDDLVTREQMSAFMHRLAVNRVVDAGSLGGVAAADYVTHSEIGTGAIDADTLDGLDSTKFLRSTAKAVDADKLDGLDSTKFLRSTAKAVDADRLDGKDSSAFLAASLGGRAWGDQANNLADTNGSVLVAQITSPAKGMVIMGGNVDITATTGEDKLWCELAINGTMLAGTQMFVNVINGPGSDEAICSTSGIAVVGPGTFTLTLDVTELNTAELWGGTLWAQWVPFDGEGLVPASVSDLSGTSEEPRELRRSEQ